MSRDHRDELYMDAMYWLNLESKKYNGNQNDIREYIYGIRTLYRDAMYSLNLVLKTYNGNIW